ncbi:MAG TPA: hypothetical protein PLN95_04360 [Candidatus Saccharibacteria bacterium]|nr:hypothetical protein [Candidatus Saccharibacteria bacterium]
MAIEVKRINKVTHDLFVGEGAIKQLFGVPNAVLVQAGHYPFSVQWWFRCKSFIHAIPYR